MSGNETAKAEDFSTINDVCYNCWRTLVFSNDQYEHIDLILSNPGLYGWFQQHCTFDRCSGAGCVFCSASTDQDVPTVKDDVVFVEYNALRTINFSEWPLEELFIQMSLAPQDHGEIDKLALGKTSVLRGFNLGILAVYFARAFDKDKRYRLSFARSSIALRLSDNVVSHFNSMYNSRIGIAVDFLKKASAMSTPDDELDKLILDYIQFAYKQETRQQGALNAYKKRLREVVVEVLEKEFDTFVEDYRELFNYIDRIYNQDRLLFEQFLRMQIDVSYELQERLKIAKFEVSRNVMTFTGYYNKYARCMSQTVWSLDKSLKSELSVEECLCAPLQDICDGERYKFMPSGREDYDVRTTGSGRKFCVDIYNCKRDPFHVFQIIRMMSYNGGATQHGTLGKMFPLLSCEYNLSDSGDFALNVSGEAKEYYILKGGNAIEGDNTNSITISRVSNRSLVETFGGGEINKSEVSAAAKFYGLKIVFESRAERQMIQSDAENKQKFYTCLVLSEEPIGFEDLKAIPKGPIPIRQRNPLRTSHRKTQNERKRMIYDITVEQLHPRMLLIHLRTQAGTYVKEFVNGDIGRTSPSISSFLGGKTLYVTHLDVVGFS